LICLALYFLVGFAFTTSFFSMSLGAYLLTLLSRWSSVCFLEGNVNCIGRGRLRSVSFLIIGAKEDKFLFNESVLPATNRIFYKESTEFTFGPTLLSHGVTRKGLNFIGCSSPKPSNLALK